MQLIFLKCQWAVSPSIIPLSLWNLVCEFCLLSSDVRLTATTLDGKIMEHFHHHRTFHWSTRHWGEERVLSPKKRAENWKSSSPNLGRDLLFRTTWTCGMFSFEISWTLCSHCYNHNLEIGTKREGPLDPHLILWFRRLLTPWFRVNSSLFIPIFFPSVIQPLWRLNKRMRVQSA